MDVTKSASPRSATWRPSPRTAALWAAALVPFGAALAAHAVGSQPRTPAPGPPRPALAMDQYVINLGEIDDRRFVVGRFGFRNAGDRPVEITALEPSCGCLRPRLDKRNYAAGEAGEFFLRIQTAGEAPGPHEYFVDLKYTAPEPHSVRLTMKVVLPEQKVVIEPKALVVYALGESETTHEVTITDYRGYALETVGVSSSSELARAELAGMDEDEDGHRRIRVRVTAAAQVPPGIHRTLISVRTNDPEHALLQIPVVLRGKDEETERGVPEG
ncbi:MAG: DUF1573 domain-containing protein [Planctomycetaceae bacterium]